MNNNDLEQPPKDDATANLASKSKSFRFKGYLCWGMNLRMYSSVRIPRDGGGDQHPSISVLAMKALLGLERYGEAKKRYQFCMQANDACEMATRAICESSIVDKGTGGTTTVYLAEVDSR